MTKIEDKSRNDYQKLAGSAANFANEVGIGLIQ